MVTFEYNARPLAIVAVVGDTVFAKRINKDGSVSKRRAKPFPRDMVERSIDDDLDDGILPEIKDHLKREELQEIHQERNRHNRYYRRKRCLVCDTVRFFRVADAAVAK